MMRRNASILLVGCALMIFQLACGQALASPTGPSVTALPTGEATAPAASDATPLFPPPESPTPVSYAPATYAASTPASLAPTPWILPHEHTPAPGEIEMLGRLYRLGQPRLIEDAPSPDGKWRAFVERFDCSDIGQGTVVAAEFLRLAQADSSGSATIDWQFQYCGGLGAFGLGGMFWSADSRFFYYTDARQGLPDGGCAPWYPPLIRYDTTANLKQALESSLPSPDRRWIASFSAGGLRLWRADQEAGQAYLLPGAARSYRAMAWPPGGEALAVLVNETAGCLPVSGDRSHILLVDIAGGLLTPLIDSRAPSFTSLAWSEAGYLLLGDSDGVEWRYLLAAGKLVPGE